MTTEHNPSRLPAAVAASTDRSSSDTLSPDGVAGPLPAELPVVRGYEVLEEIARGGMGVVYRAQHLSLNRVVALKMVLSADLASPEQLLRFRLEAELAARAQHPGIVGVYEVGSWKGVPFLAMEWLPGGTLARRLVSGALPPGEAARLLQTLARAVGAAHAQGVIHRDLKPANVLFAEDGTPKVVDFGLARSSSMETGLTRTGAILGTPEYMAPEQASGKKEQSVACDIYALGAILYECLTGRPPFRGKNSLETLQQVAADEPRSPRSLVGGVPRDLETICLKCLRKEPGQRYRSVAALADDLGRFLRGEPIHARRVGEVERVWKWARRRPAIACLLLAVVVSLLAGTAISVSFAVEARGREKDAVAAKTEAEEARRDADRRARAEQQARTLAQRQSERAETALADLSTAAGLMNDERGNPATAALWFASAATLAAHDEHRGRVNRLRFQLFSRALPRTIRAWVHPWKEQAPVGKVWTWEGAIAQLLPHPDGTHLLTRSATTSRWTLWDARAGKALPLPYQERGLSAAAWSADRSRLALGSEDGRCLVLRLADRRAVCELPPGKGVAVLTFCPHDRWLAVARGQEVRLWDLGRRRYRGLKMELPAPVLWLVFDSRGKRLAVASADDAVRIYRVEAGAPGLALVAGPLVNHPTVYHFHSHQPPLWVDHDRTLLTCASMADVACWDTATGKEVRRWTPDLWNVDAIVPSPDGLYVAVAGWRGCQLYEVPTGKPVGPRLVHTERVFCAAFSPDGRTLLTGSRDQSIKRWSVPGGQVQGPTLPVSHQVDAVAFLGADFLSTHLDGLIRLWRPGLPALPFRDYPLPDAHDNDYRRFVDPTGRYLLVQASPARAQVIDLETRQPAGALIEPIAGPFYAAFLPGRSEVAIGTGQRLGAWSWRTGKTLWGPVKLPSTGYAVATSPDGRRLVWMGASSGLLLDARTGKTLARFVHEGAIDTVNSFPNARFSPDGNCFVTFRAWSSLNVWEASTARPRFPALRYTNRVSALALSPDSRHAVLGIDDNTARVIDLKTGQELARLEHPHWISDLAFSPDGQLVLTGCRDRAARLWRWRAGKLACPPLLHEGEVFAVAFLPGTPWLVTQVLPRGVQVWDSVGGKPVTIRLTLSSADRSGRYLQPVLGGRALAAFAHGKQVRLFDLGALADDNPGRLSGEQLVRLAETLCQFRIHEGSGVARLTTAEWLLRWRGLPPGQGDLSGAAGGPSSLTWSRDRLDDALVGGDDGAAAYHLGQLLHHQPADAALHVHRAHVLARLGRRQESATHLMHALVLTPRISLWPVDPGAAQRGERAAQAGDWPRALEAFRLAARQPGQGASHLASVLLAQVAAGDRAGARESLKEAAGLIRRQPGTPLAGQLLYAAQVLSWDRPEVDLFLDLARRYVKQAPNASTLYFHGSALYRAGRYALAEQALAASLAAHGQGGHVDTWLFQAMTLRKRGKDEEAGALLARFEAWHEKQTLADWRQRVRWATLLAEARSEVRTLPPMKRVPLGE